MRKYLSQIFALLFLLVITGSKLMAFSQEMPIPQAIEKVASVQKHSNKIGEHRFEKYNVDTKGFTTIETDVQDFDFSTLLSFIAISSKILVFAFILLFLNTKYKKRHFFYDAFIRLFSTKYIVLRSLRI